MEHLTLAPIFQDHMLLQRDKPIHVWGCGPEDALVTVCLGPCRGSDRVHGGRWHCTLPPHPAARDMEMNILTDIPGFPVKKITDLSIGDVWLAGGQSNMEYFLRYDAHWDEIRNAPYNPDIRMYNVPRLCFEGQQKDVSDSGHWFGEQDPAWETFSAPGYCFARALQPSLGVPVGIIGCNWGGTPACAWVSEETLSENEALRVFLTEYEEAVRGCDPVRLRRESLAALAFDDSPAHQAEWRCMMYGLSREEQLRWLDEHAGEPACPMGPLNACRPGGLYHRMLEPLAPFSLKGVLWYQGESDSGHAELYDVMFSSLIGCWRRLWGDELPFLFVQLAPFGEWLECTSEGYAEVRRRQERVAKTVPGAYMTSIMDLGMYWDIHPKRKREVGERLALLARGRVYGEDLLCEPAEFLSARREGDTILLSFLHAGTGLSLRGPAAAGLSVRCSSQTLEPVSAQVRGDCLCLTFSALPAEPVHLSLGEEGYAELNLFNSAGLPAKPFSCVV